jgi:hypothetical protein
MRRHRRLKLRVLGFHKQDLAETVGAMARDLAQADERVYAAGLSGR